MISTITIKTIRVYQKYISPKKGFICAYGYLHHDLSCPAFCIQQIEMHGILNGLKRTLHRFSDCRKASIILKEKANNSVYCIKRECKSMNTCDGLIIGEFIAEVACCACTGIS